MPDQKLTALTVVVPAPSDIVYVVDDPAGVPLSRKATIADVVAEGLDRTGATGNLIKNSPGQIPVDGAEPQWWDDSGSATFTDEDAVGEGIPDISERVYKLVTVADNHYGYQTITMADEERLDAGVTIVSLAAWVYCATGAKASIAINGANLGLQESAQVGAGAWELLTVENITLNGADATIEVRFYADTDTAFIAYPMLNVGSKPLAWVARGDRFVAITTVAQFDLNPTGDVAWSDTDATANTDPLAISVNGYSFAFEPDGVLSSSFQVGHSDTLLGADSAAAVISIHMLNQNLYYMDTLIACDDSQVFRYTVNENDGDSDMRALFRLIGYWMWA